MPQIRTHLMFQGEAEAALAFYADVFPGFRVTRLSPEDAPFQAAVDFHGHALSVFDSPPVHAFSFTPSVSLFVDLDDAETLDAAFAALAEGGAALMPPGDHGFSRRFAWVQDRFGLSWQLNLP